MGEHIVDKEMGIGLKDFHRLASGVLGGGNFTGDGSSIVFEDDDKRIEVTCAEMPERRIAMMRIPVLRVRLKFSGYGDGDLERALARFDKAFARTGG